MDLITLFGKLNFSMEYFPRYSRLCGTMKAFKLSIQMKLDKNPDENWVKEVNSLLRQAKDFLKEFKIDEAWRCFHTAQRVSVYGMNPHEIIDAVKELRNEVSKLNEWRRKSINDILGPPNNQGAGAIAPESLIKALQIKDEYYNNQYYKNKLTRKLYSLLFTLLSINVLAIFSFVFFHGLESLTGNLVEYNMLIGVVLFGLLGALTSAILFTRTQSELARITEIRSNRFLVMSKVAVGIGFTLFIYIILKSGISDKISLFSFEIKDPMDYYAIAYISGFTERLAQKAISLVIGDDKSKEEKQTAPD